MLPLCRCAAQTGPCSPIEDHPVNKLSFVTVLALIGSAGLAVAQPEKKDEKKPEAVPATKIQPVKEEKKKDEKKKDEVTLKVGSDAPKIEATKWVKGTEVKSFEKGKVYIVEFWATWCPPCIKSIPHLTEMAKKYTDVTIIGMASSERQAKDAKTDNRLEVVEKFVKDQGEKMEYTVAYDADRKMSASWMRPAGQGGIPCAFIVNGEGKIAWIGNPLDPNFESEIAKVAKPVESKDGKDKHKDKNKDGKQHDKSKPETSAPAKDDKKK